MGYAPFRAQRDAHKALLLDNKKRAVLYWSRRLGKCLGEGTLVLTPNGPVPVEKLKPGDDVYGYENGEVVPSKVTHAEDNGVQETYAIKNGNYTWYATKNHRWLTNYASSSNLPGDRVSTLKYHRGQSIRRAFVKIPCGTKSVPYAYALGALIGDGCCTETSNYAISSQDEVVVAKAANQLGCTYKKRPSNNCTWSISRPRIRTKTGQYSSTIVSEYRDWLKGRKAHQKVIDWEEVNTWDRESCLELVAGLIDTDGSVFLNAEQRLIIALNQQSRSVAETYQKLILKLWQIKVSITEDTRDKYVNGSVLAVSIQSNFHSVRILRELSSYIQCERKQFKTKYDSLKAQRNPDSLGFKLSEGGNRQTYDITVSNPSHLYVLAEEGLITHNTLWAIHHLMWAAMLKQGPYFIVYKEYQHAETVAWDQFIRTIPKELIKSTDKKLLTITFNHLEGEVKFPEPFGKRTLTPDNSKAPSIIRLLGSDKAESHRGNEAMGMIFDEYQDQDSYGWDFVYKLFFATTDGWAAFMGTAKDDDNWNDLLDKAREKDDWYYSEATWRENPYIKPEWIEKERAEAERDGKLGSFLQETELIPFSQQGAVYPEFDRRIHVVSQDVVPKEGTDYICMDFGFAEGHPLAIGFIRITRDDIWYQWDEIYGTGIQLDDALAEMKAKMGDRPIAGIVADSARPDLIDYMGSKGFPVIPSPKKANSVLSGIELLRMRIKPKIQIIGNPRPNYYVTRNCKSTIYEWTHYKYREAKANRHPSETPEKKFDDMSDAIRYLALFFKYGKSSDSKPKTATAIKELNEYGL